MHHIRAFKSRMLDQTPDSQFRFTPRHDALSHVHVKIKHACKKIHLKRQMKSKKYAMCAQRELSHT